MNEIHCGDIRDIAKTLPDQSVNCIVTSPPYFGLRDYQTAEWEGGEAECDHKLKNARNDPDRDKRHTDGRNPETQNLVGIQDIIQYSNTCPKCGAKRIDKQIGLEESPEAYVNTLVGIFRELKRVLRDDGTIWLNLGDSYANTKIGNTNEAPDKRARPYFENGTHQMDFKKTIPAGMKPKNLLGIPWRVAFALQADVWILRSDIIWHKKNPMPESVKDRPTKAHEYIFLLSKKPRYYYDNEAVRDTAKTLPHNAGYINGECYAVGPMNRNGHSQREDPDRVWAQDGKRNRRTVWSVSTRPYKSAHFAVFPPDLIRPCILAGCPQQVCAECGKPWERIIKRGMTAHDGKTDSKYANGTNANRMSLLRQAARERGGEYVNTAESVGVEPTCQCNAPSCPGVVLDPFMGSGTVAQVAIETGRNWLGVELNPEYIELANKRIAQTQPALPIEITL